MAKFELYPGFPFYSFDSDNPSFWPIRVFDDRKNHTSKILEFITNPSFQHSINSALLKSESAFEIETISNIVFDSQLEKEQILLSKYMYLRGLCNGQLGGNEAKINELLDVDVFNAFLDLERDWQSLDSKMPNRLFTIAFAYNRPILLENLSISFTIVGKMYDIMLDNVRIQDQNQIDNWGIARRHTISLGNLLPSSTIFLKIFYNYIPLAERISREQIHYLAEANQGMLLHSIGAVGPEIKKTNTLITDKNVYHDYEVDFNL
jgi:hypothetical protein